MKKYICLFVLLLFLNEVSAQWIQIENIPSNEVPSIFVNENNIYVGTNNVVYFSDDYGKNWQASSVIDEENDVDFISTVVVHKGKIYAGTYNFGVYVSADNGTTWTQMNNGLFGAGGQTIIDLLVRGDSIYAGTAGAGIFIRDLNESNGWSHYSNGLYFEISYNINSLKLIDNIIYAGAGGNGTFYKNDGTSTLWQEVKFGDLQSQPLIMNDIIKLNSEFIISATYGLYKSKDGINWNYYNPGIGFSWNSNFAVHGQKIFVHLSKGGGRTFLFESTDYGESWNFLEQQDGNEIYYMTVVDNKLLAGKFFGLWYLDLNTTEVDDDIISDGFVLHQNYPNPFNPVTKISYSIPKSGFVSLKIYDVLGKEISTLVNNEMKAGIHEIEFNGSNLASGVYYYQLRSGNFSETKKFVLIK